MEMDIGISASLAIVTILMAYLGVHVTLHPAESDSKRRAYKAGFFVCAGIAVALVVLQGARNGATQTANINAMSSLQKDVKDAKTETERVRTDLEKSHAEVLAEIARRQQAETDMKLMVQATGQQTRSGVAEDLRKAPINLSVNGENRSLSEAQCNGLAKLSAQGRALTDKLFQTRGANDTRLEISKWFQAVCDTLASSSQCEAFMSSPTPSTVWNDYPVEDGGFSRSIRGRTEHLSGLLGRLCR